MPNQKFYETYPEAVTAVFNGDIDIAWCIVPHRYDELHLIRIDDRGGPTPQHITMLTDTDRGVLLDRIRGDVENVTD